MADLFVGNIDADLTDDDIKEFLVKYGFPPFDAIAHVPGEGSRPAVILTFEGTGPELLRRLQPRVNNMFWKNRKITVQVMKDRSE
jgi:RNA recognition motif-containing protein